VGNGEAALGAREVGAWEAACPAGECAHVCVCVCVCVYTHVLPQHLLCSAGGCSVLSCAVLCLRLGCRFYNCPGVLLLLFITFDIQNEPHAFIEQ